MHSLVRSFTSLLLFYFRPKVNHYDFNFFPLCGMDNSWASFEGIPIIILLTKLRGFESLVEGNPAALKWTAFKIYITKSFKFYRDLLNNNVDDNLEEMVFTTCGGRSEISVIQFGRHNNTFPSLAAYIQCTKQNLVCLHVQLRLLSPFLFFCSSFICSEHEQAELINCTCQLAVQFAFTLSLFHPEMSPSADLTAPFQELKVS